MSNFFHIILNESVSPQAIFKLILCFKKTIYKIIFRIHIDDCSIFPWNLYIGSIA